MGARFSTAAAAALTLAAPGCGGADGGGSLATGRDSAGVSIVENASPDDSAAYTWWRVEGPLVDIGGFEAEEPYALFQVSDALRRADGSIVVANGGSSDIRFYDAAGTHVRTVGGAGGGPGEYQATSSLAEGPGDSLLVVDTRARRISVLDAEGAFARTLEVPDPAATARLRGWFADGSFLSTTSVPLPDDALNSGGTLAFRGNVALSRSVPGTGTVDTLATYPGPERVITVATDGGRIASISIGTPPFARAPTYTAHGDEVFVGTQDAPEIRVHGMDGALRRIVRTGRAGEPVTERHLSEYEESRLASLPEARRAEARASGQYRSEHHGPDVPPYGSLLVDRAGHLWVADYADPTDPPGRWTVYGPDGAALTRIVLPERFVPYDIGEDWVLGRARDELDVEHVRIYRLVRS